MRQGLSSREIGKIKKFGRVIKSKSILIKYLPGKDFSFPAIVISTKTEKKTTVRNQLKRIIRSAWQKEGKNYQLVIFFRSLPTKEETKKEIKECFGKLF